MKISEKRNFHSVLWNFKVRENKLIAKTQFDVLFHICSSKLCATHAGAPFPLTEKQEKVMAQTKGKRQCWLLVLWSLE